MTDATDMAKRLRRLPVYYPIMREAMVVPEAADLIESQDARIAELFSTLAATRSELEAVKAELRELKEDQPC